MKHYCVNYYMYLFFVYRIECSFECMCIALFKVLCVFEQRDIVLNKHFDCPTRQMASRADTLRGMPLMESEETEAWLRALAAKGRAKQIRDALEDGPSEMTDLFLSEAGMDTIRQVSTMASPQTLEDMSFKDIRQLIMTNLQPKKRLVMAERTRFLATTQGSAEDVEYVQSAESPPSLDNCLQFAQQLELIHNFNSYRQVQAISMLKLMM